MKRLTFLLLVVLALTGCAIKDYYAACKADEACVNRAKQISVSVDQITESGVALVPHPAAQVAAPIAGQVVGKGALLISMVILGYGMLKKKKVANGQNS